MNLRKTLLTTALTFVSTIMSISTMADTVAFTAPAGVVSGGANSPVNLGLTFTANADITVNALGIWNQPGLTSSETVGIFDATSQTLLTSTTVSLTDTLNGGYLFHSITPLALSAGQQYIVDAYTGNNSWGWGAAPIVNSPMVTFDTHLYTYTNSLQLPVSFYGVANQAYYGPNFTFAPTAAPVPVPPAIWLFGSALFVLIAINRRKNVQNLMTNAMSAI